MYDFEHPRVCFHPQFNSEFPAHTDDGAAPVSSDLVPLRLPAAPGPAVRRYPPLWGWHAACSQVQIETHGDLQ